MPRTFEEASRHIQASLQKHLETVDIISNDDSDQDSSNEEDLNTDDLVERVFGSYGIECGGDTRTKEALISCIGSGSCLICIGDLKRKDIIWNCTECYCSFHLQCIQRWAQDSIFQQQRDFDNNDLVDLSRPFPVKNLKKDLKWGCPKCRATYTESETPKKYTCYCGKVTDPQFDPWIVPHSCGETCEKNLKPYCGHQCLILCHPGPCPPCPKIGEIFKYFSSFLFMFKNHFSVFELQENRTRNKRRKLGRIQDFSL